MVSLTTSAVCCIVWGVLSLLGGLLPPPLVNEAAEKRINSATSIKSAMDDEQQFKEWQSNDPALNGRNPAEQPITLWQYYFFNLTNPEFTQTGESPRFVEKGPYVYRQNLFYFNVSFNDNETEVTYQEWSRMIFDASLSGSGLSEDDEITTIYFSYNSVLMSRGLTETEFLVGGFAQQMIQTFVSTFQLVSVNLGVDPISTTAAQWGGLGYLHASFIETPLIVSALNLTSNGQRVAQIFQGIQSVFASYAEFGKIGMLSNETSTNLLYGNSSAGFACSWINGSFMGQPCPAVFARLASEDPAVLLQVFPIPPTERSQIPLLVTYLIQLSHAFAATVLHSAKFATPMSSLMFVKRKPAEILYHFDDPLLALNGMDSETAFFPEHNQPDIDHAFQVWPWRQTQKTGKGDSSETSKWVMWHDTEVLPSRNGSLSNPGFWCDVDESISSYSYRQFPPGKADRYMFENTLTKDDTLPVFVDVVYRKIDFQFVKEVEVKGIKAWRFGVAAHEFNANPTRYSNLLPGVINLTCIAGAPLFVTLPHFNRVGPLPFPLPDIGAPDPDIHDVLVDIEPRTGSALQGHNRLQLNAMATISGNITLFPMFWGDNYVVLTDKNADDFKDAMAVFRSIQISLIVLVVIGGMLFLVGVTLLCASCKPRSSDRKEGMSMSTPGHPVNSGDIPSRV